MPTRLVRVRATVASPTLPTSISWGTRAFDSQTLVRACSHAAMQSPQHAHEPCSDNGCQRSQQTQMHCMQSPQHAQSHVEMVVVGAHIKHRCTAQSHFEMVVVGAHIKRRCTAPDVVQRTSHSFLLPSFETRPIRVHVYAYIVSAHPPTLHATTALTLCDTPPLHLVF